MAKDDLQQNLSDDTTERPRWSIIGPGLVVAATGIGAGDLVATLAAGAQYGYALLWAAIAGVLIKIALVEGAGRWTLASGKSIFEGWRSLGLWTTFYFAPYIVVWGFVYGAAAMSSTALPLHSLFPDVDLKIFAIAAGVLGAVIVWFGHYRVFEIVIAVFVGIMFITVVGAAVVAAPNVGEVVSGLIPMIPEGGLFYTLGIAGGVGGTITLAAYGYWLQEKGWRTPRWMKVMRIDNTMAYVLSGIFVVSMLIVGAELLYSSGVSLTSGDAGLIDLAGVLQDRYGQFFAVVFLIGFFASAFSSILGVWNGVSLMFADFMGHMLGMDKDDPRRKIGGLWYRVYIVLLTLPPISLLFLGQPVFLVVLYGALGSLFMPFLAITLLLLMNSKRVPQEWRNKWLANSMMVIVTVLFLVLGVQQLIKALAPVFGG